MKTLTVSGDFFINNGYWQYECAVQVNSKSLLIWDCEIIKAKGRGVNDEYLELTDDIEDIIIEKAEEKAEELINDPLVPADMTDEED